MASPDDSLLSTSLPPPLTSSPFDHQTPPTTATWSPYDPSSNGRSSSSPAIDYEGTTPPHHRSFSHHHSYNSMTPQLIAIQESMNETPTSSPSLRSASGRFKGVYMSHMYRYIHTSAYMSLLIVYTYKRPLI